jgi:type I restriction enzyme S subunit
MNEGALHGLPGGWVWTRLGDITEIITGNTPSKKDLLNYGDFIPFVKPPELKDCTISEASDNLSENGAKFARILPQDSVLVSCIGNLGKIGINKIPVAFNQQINSVIFPKDEIIPKYGFYYFQTLEIKMWLKGISSATTIPIVNKSKFKTTPFYFPPLPEQRAIVSKIEQLFSDLDNGIENFKKAQEQLKIYRQVVLKNACEGKLVPTEAELARAEGRGYEAADMLLARILKERREKWNGKGKYKEPAVPDTSGLPELPEGWIWTKMNVVCNKIQDGTHFSPKKQFDKPANGRYLYITAKNIKENGLKLTNITYVDESFHQTIYKRCNPEKGDVLLIKDGVTTGTATINTLNEEFSLLSSVALLKANKDALYSYYLKNFLNSPTGFKIITGKMTGTAIKRIILAKIKNSNIPLPPLIEQRRIVAEVERRLSLSDKMEATIAESLQKAESLRQSILKKAFEGKLLNEKELEEARNALDWEPAEKLLERIKAEKTNTKRKNKGEK